MSVLLGWSGSQCAERGFQAILAAGAPTTYINITTVHMQRDELLWTRVVLVSALSECDAASSVFNCPIDIKAGFNSSLVGIATLQVAFARTSLGNLTVSESVGVLELGLQLVRLSDGSTSHDGSTDPISVAWQVFADSGSDVSAPSDVAALEGVASFAAGVVNTSMLFSIEDNDVFAWGRLKRFELRLTSVTVGASSIMASRSSIWINITDDDVPPVISVHADSLRVDVTAGQMASIQLVRTGWLQSAVKVTFITDGSAQLGVDYTVGQTSHFTPDRNASNCSNIAPCSSNTFSCSCAQACDGQ